MLSHLFILLKLFLGGGGLQRTAHKQKLSHFAPYNVFHLLLSMLRMDHGMLMNGARLRWQKKKKWGARITFCVTGRCRS